MVEKENIPVMCSITKNYLKYKMKKKTPIVIKQKIQDIDDFKL
jgi:hypothetical protein